MIFVIIIKEYESVLAKKKLKKKCTIASHHQNIKIYRNHEYYTSLRRVDGLYVFTELNNEPLEDWNEWGTITGDTCTVYSNVGGFWYWHTNNCDQPSLYICEYIVPTPGSPFEIIYMNRSQKK